MTADPGPEPTFDLDLYLTLPRVAGLALAPDGGRLVTSVATPAPDGKKFTSALWELDPAGQAAPRRLTRSAPGEADAAFLPDGSVLFTSARDDPEAAGDAKGDGEVARLWLLPAGGGEARPVADRPGRDRPGAGRPRRRHGGVPDRRPPGRRRPGGRRAPRQGPHRRRGQRPAVRDLPDPLLGPLPGAEGAAAVRGGPAPGRRGADGAGPAADPGAGPGPRRGGRGRHPRRRDRGLRLGHRRGRQPAHAAGGDRRGRRRAAGAAGRPGVLGGPGRLLPRRPAGGRASGSGTATPTTPWTSACGWSTWPAARAATCWPGSSCGPRSRPGRPTAGRCSSSPTPTAAPRCSGSRSAATTTAG